MHPASRSLSRAFGAAAVLAAACLGLVACGSGDDGALKVRVIGGAEAPFAGGQRGSVAAGLVRSATAQGLVGFDGEGRVIPGLAERWIVTADGQHYIFRLADGTWSDGTAITGENVRTALQQALEAQQDTPLGLDLSGIADIRAMAGRVVEIRLSRPMPDLLQLLAQSELGLLHHGKGDGPMALTRQGTSTLLTPIPPEKRGLAPVEGWAGQVRPISLTVSDAASVLAAFSAGQADAVLGGTFNDLPRTHHSHLGKASARPDPVAGLFGFRVVRTDGLLATPQLREAIALSIDRDALAWSLGAGGWNPSTRIVSPGMEGDPGLVGERWQDLDIDSRRLLAAKRIAIWQAGSHQSAIIRISLPTGPGADILFDRLTADLAPIGVSVQRADKAHPADLVLVDVVARYPRVAWFIDALACGENHAACSPQADALAQRARRATDEQSAALLWAQAEVVLTQTNVFISLGPPIRWSLVNGETSGFSVNRLGIHPLFSLAMGKKS